MGSTKDLANYNESLQEQFICSRQFKNIINVLHVWLVSSFFSAGCHVCRLDLDLN